MTDGQFKINDAIIVVGGKYRGCFGIIVDAYDSNGRKNYNVRARLYQAVRTGNDIIYREFAPNHTDSDTFQVGSSSIRRMTHKSDYAISNDFDLSIPNCSIVRCTADSPVDQSWTIEQIQITSVPIAPATLPDIKKEQLEIVRTHIVRVDGKWKKLTTKEVVEHMCNNGKMDDIDVLVEKKMKIHDFLKLLLGS